MYICHQVQVVSTLEICFVAVLLKIYSDLSE